MRLHLSEKAEEGRISGEGLNGRFKVQGPCGAKLFLWAFDGARDWEHVAVDLDPPRRSPNWQEMCFAKDLFWGPEECVMQIHPPLSQYVKNNYTRLHLWKPKDAAIPQPPSRLVGFAGLGPDDATFLLRLIESLADDPDPAERQRKFVFYMDRFLSLDAGSVQKAVEDVRAALAGECGDTL